MEKTSVFLSYGAKLPLSGKVAADLIQKLGGSYDIWSSSMLQAGNSRTLRYEKMKLSDVVILLVEEGTSAVFHVNREIGAARGAGVGIVILLLDRSLYNALHELDISDLQYLYYDESAVSVDQLRKLIDQTAASARQTRRGNSIAPFEAIFGSPSKDAQFLCDAFMIMPFREELSSVYHDCIKPTVEDLNLVIKRGDVFSSQKDIMQEIWSAIYASRVVIADCTGRNANVFYELGIAHTLGKQFILITQNKEDVPFDIQAKRFIPYSNDAAGLARLREQLREALIKTLNL